MFLSRRMTNRAGAKTERQLRLLGALAPNVYKSMINAFKKRYPFVTDVSVDDIGSIDAKQRFLLELKSKRAAGGMSSIWLQLVG